MTSVFRSAGVNATEDEDDEDDTTSDEELALETLSEEDRLEDDDVPSQPTRTVASIAKLEINKDNFFIECTNFLRVDNETRYSGLM